MQKFRSQARILSGLTVSPLTAIDSDQLAISALFPRESFVVFVNNRHSPEIRRNDRRFGGVIFAISGKHDGTKNRTRTKRTTRYGELSLNLITFPRRTVENARRLQPTFYRNKFARPSPPTATDQHFHRDPRGAPSAILELPEHRAFL